MKQELWPSIVTLIQGIKIEKKSSSALTPGKPEWCATLEFCAPESIYQAWEQLSLPDRRSLTIYLFNSVDESTPNF